jgi:hypothetical protein
MQVTRVRAAAVIPVTLSEMQPITWPTAHRLRSRVGEMIANKVNVRADKN